MKPVHVLVLAVVAIVAAFAVFQGGGDSAAPESSGQLVFPALSGVLDDIDTVELTDASSGVVTLARRDGAWTVKQKSDYHADPVRLGELILAVSRARQLEQKTANPDFYERLGLRDISDAESAATLLRLSGNGQAFALLTGNTTNRFGGSTYVRQPDQAGSMLVSPALRVSTDVDSWLDKQVLDIASSDVQSVVVKRPDSSVEIRKDSATDAAFVVTDADDSQTPNEATVRSLSRGLTGLTFDDVRIGYEFAFSDFERTTVTYTLFSGITVNVTLFYRAESDDGDGPPRAAEYWLNANASFDPAVAQQYAPQPTATVDGTEPEPLVLTAADIADRRADAEAINDKIKLWMYRITSTRFGNMSPAREALLVSE